MSNLPHYGRASAGNRGVENDQRNIFLGVYHSGSRGVASKGRAPVGKSFVVAGDHNHSAVPVGALAQIVEQPPDGLVGIVYSRHVVAQSGRISSVERYCLQFGRNLEGGVAREGVDLYVGFLAVGPDFATLHFCYGLRDYGVVARRVAVDALRGVPAVAQVNVVDSERSGHHLGVPSPGAVAAEEVCFGSLLLHGVG